uniref:(northern house mosquito) hypothetical protein n=1 Tax=Culex pipiens TaxID=7175 RepID=A0A8D8F6J1_CULPI
MVLAVVEQVLPDEDDMLEYYLGVDTRAAVRHLAGIVPRVLCDAPVYYQLGSGFHDQLERFDTLDCFGRDTGTEDRSVIPAKCRACGPRILWYLVRSSLADDHCIWFVRSG